MLHVEQPTAQPDESNHLPDPCDYVEQADRLPLKLRWSLVHWLRQTGSLVETAAVLDGIERERGLSGTLLEERAQLAQLEDRPADAERLLRQRVDLAPSATVRVALGRFLLDAGRHTEAAAIGRELDQTDPELATVLQFRAHLARASGDHTATRAALETILERRPDHFGAMAELAEVALAEGDTRGARALIDHALDLADAEPPVSLLTAAISVFAALGDVERVATLREHEHAVRSQAEERVAERRRELAAEIEKIIGRAESPHPRAARDLPPPNLPPPGGGDAPESGRGVSKERSSFSGSSSDVGNGSELTLSRSTARERGLGGEGSLESSSQSSVLSPRPSPETPPNLDPRVLPTLRDQFGFDTLRPGQDAVIANVLAGHDTLATMPTGAGKSLTFQLPAMLLDGVTLVLSPLIALMKDQVEGLPAAVRNRAVLVNSSLSPEEQRDALERIAAGDVKLVYAAPERLRQASFLAALRQAGVALVVVDEAHCISLWGHDFRPDYLSIPVALNDFRDATVLAITATATPDMADAIAAGLRRPLHRVQTSVFRANLFYEVYRLPNRNEKVARLLSLAEKEQGPGIVYVSSRRDTETIAGLLRGRGINAVPYHAGLERDLRADNQRRFMSGQARVVVATVAFGMGVDKANVRWIIHLSPPMSVAAYAQESGRAGRDGQLSHCVLLSTNADRTSLLTLARRNEIDLGTLREVYAAIGKRAAGQWVLVDVGTLVPDDAEDPYAERDRVRVALGVLEQARLLTRHPDTAVTRTVGMRADAAPVDDPKWPRFVAWSGLEERLNVTVRTAEACAALDLTPVDFERLLAAHADAAWSREGQRVACFELHPPPPDIKARLESLLDRSRTAARERIDEVFSYASADTCRHVVLAAHLGERIEPCHTVCDICTGRATRRADTQPKEKPAAQRRATTAADALAVLEAVRTVPFAVGKTGLVRLLVGSAESSIRADRSPSYGVLGDVVKARVDNLIDRLIEDGFLFRDMNHDYKIITLTDRGRAATEDDLASYQQVAPASTSRGGSRSAGGSMDEAQPLDEEGEAVYGRLTAWRAERAAADGMPAYVIAHNSMLHDLALIRPRTMGDLTEVSGFGGKRIEKYGDEVLAIINGG